MGAKNALRVYEGWGALPDRPLRLLVYMALVARDDDAEPWFALGHEALARFALAMDLPELDDDDPRSRAARDAVLRKVRRAVTTLHRRRAIETTRKATFGHRGPGPVRYRLWLDGPKPPSSGGVTDIGARRRRPPPPGPGVAGQAGA